MVFDTVQFVYHELDSTGINMTQKRIGSTIQFTQSNSLTELYSLLEMINYFLDHIPQYFLVAQPLHAMVSVAVKAKQKQITWTKEGRRAFSTCDASDYAHGTYLCQEQKTGGWHD